MIKFLPENKILIDKDEVLSVRDPDEFADWQNEWIEGVIDLVNTQDNEYSNFMCRLLHDLFELGLNEPQAAEVIRLSWEASKQIGQPIIF